MTVMALPPNSVNMNSFYMDHFMQVGQTGSHPGWYNDYNSFNNLLVTPTVQPSQVPVPQHHPVHHQNFVLPPMPPRTKPPPPPPPPQPPPLPMTRPRTTLVDRTYYCDICGASFSNSSNLKSHSRIHTGEKPYTCEICGASFVQSSNLKAHKRIHTGERPYTCSECGQSFSRSSHLIGHKRTHTGERPYICGICQDSFVTSTHLRNHMRKHTGERPFSCHICKSAFAQNASLQIHLRIHTGERPYKCGECTAAFRSKGDLRSHLKLHTDEKPFSCYRCGKLFKTNQYLQKHLKKCGAPPTGKKRGRPRKMLPNETVMLSIPKKKVNSNSGRGRGRTKVKLVRTRPRSTRLSRRTVKVEKQEESDYEELEGEKGGDFVEQASVKNDNLGVDMIVIGEKVPKCSVEGSECSSEVLNDNSNSREHLPQTLDSDMDPLDITQVQESLPEIKVCVERLDEITNSGMEQVADVNQSLQLSHVQHIDHMPIETMESIVQGSHYQEHLL